MESGFSGYHPYVILFYYLCTSFLIMYFNHPLFLMTVLLLLIFVNMTHDYGKALKKWTVPFVIMGVFIVFLNPFLVSRGTNILFYFRGKQVTLEATMYGFVMALSLIAILMMFVSFNLKLNGNKFLFIFSKFLPRTAFLIMLAIRFVPLLKRRLDEISAVQYVRGKTIVFGSLKERIRNALVMLQILLTWSLEEAIQTADSMKARGYGLGKKSSYVPYQMEKRDWIWMIILFCSLVVCIFCGLLGYGKIVIYPQLGTLHLYPLDWVAYVCMVTIISFPLLVEGRELMRWKFSK